ncbi:type II toxin-antitoxin system HigB family toxin [soil metagenome]
MKVRLLREETIEEFVKKHANSATHFNNWLNRLEYADWTVPQDITATCKGNLIGGTRVVFDIGGNGKNASRIICTFKFGIKYLRLYVNWIGTHEEYNRLSNADKMTLWDY